MEDVVLYFHGKGGSASEAAHYGPLFPDARVVGIDFKAETPWEAEEEFPALFDAACRGCGFPTVIANSIGAYFTMAALADRPVRRAFFISPVVDLKRLIEDMMTWAGVTPEELRTRREIPTDFGETLSWEYYRRVSERPVRWTSPTHVLYGGRDALVARESVEDFAVRTGADLTVMEEGEHWFHTAEQMAFLDAWIRRLC